MGIIVYHRRSIGKLATILYLNGNLIAFELKGGLMEGEERFYWVVLN